MLGTHQRSRDLVRLPVYLLLLAAFLQVAAAQNETNNQVRTALKSDEAAVQALQTVINRSGGTALWASVRSAEETFNVVNKVGDSSTHLISLLDDWSLPSTRYRRKEAGQKHPTIEHDGSPTFLLRPGNLQTNVPELDQARVLADRLPAAAAEVMLRRHEYLVKVSEKQRCSTDLICIDVFKAGDSAKFVPPEQQWKISIRSGLPSEVVYQLPSSGLGARPVWKSVSFLKYEAEGDFIIPTSMVTSVAGSQQNWTLVSFKPSVGFDTAKFDQENPQ